MQAGLCLGCSQTTEDRHSSIEAHIVYTTNRVLSVSSSLFILMEYPKHIDTISMELSILYFKGFSVKISINVVFLSLKIV